MNEFIMLVGLPASGKTTVAKKYENEGYDLFSSDGIISELFEKKYDKNKSDIVFETLHQRIRESISAGHNVIYDATNINARRREDFLRRINELGCKKHCIFMAVPYSVCVIRNQKRDNSVPFSAMERMRKTFDIPYYFEGWDEITVYKEDSVCKFEPFDYVDSFANTEQDSPNHSLTLGGHMKEAWRYAVNQEYNYYVQWAALLHDIGKPATKTFTKMNGVVDSRAHYYNHQNVGAYNSLFLDYPKELSNEDILHIALLINYHMVPYTFGTSDNGRNKMKKKLGNEIYEEMMQVHYCDINAH